MRKLLIKLLLIKTNGESMSVNKELIKDFPRSEQIRILFEAFDVIIADKDGEIRNCIEKKNYDKLINGIEQIL